MPESEKSKAWRLKVVEVAKRLQVEQGLSQSKAFREARKQTKL